MKVIKKIFDIFIDMIIVLVFIITIYLVYLNIKGKNTFYVKVFGLHFDVCETNSMEPTINVGDLVVSVVCNDKTEINNGDIITYYYQRVGKQITITHRVIEINDDYYITQGDNREVSIIPDKEITKDKILGKMVFRIPKIGKIIDFCKTKLGFFLCIVIPLVVLIVIKLLEFIKTKPKYISNSEKEEIIKEYLDKYKE